MNKFWQIIISLAVAVVVLAAVFYGLNILKDVGPKEDMEEENTESEASGDVVLKTSMGDIVLELFDEEVPRTAGNFRTLAGQSFYDGTKFHRVIEGFMIQGGDPKSKDDSLKDEWGTGGPGYQLDDEFAEGLSNVRGTISMANSGPDTNGSQFFINVADNLGLDFDKEPLSSGHSVFGRVVSGMDVIDAVVSVDTEGPDRPVNDVVIEKVVVN